MYPYINGEKRFMNFDVFYYTTGTYTLMFLRFWKCPLIFESLTEHCLSVAFDKPHRVSRNHPVRPSVHTSCKRTSFLVDETIPMKIDTVAI